MNPSPLSPGDHTVLFEKIFRNASITSMLILDLRGNILDVNEGFLQSFDYSKDVLIGKNFSLLFTKEDQFQQLPERELEETIRTGSSRDNNYLIDGNGVAVWVNGESILTECIPGRQCIVKIVQDTRIQKLLEEELVKRNEDQEKIINDRNLFIHTASHDLRSPISNIRGLVSSLREYPNDPEEMALTIELLDQSVERLSGKLNELAAIGKEQEEKTYLKLQEALEEVLLDLEDEIQESGAEIVFDFSKVSFVHFSKRNLKSILQNFISNAIKFRSPKRKAKITVSTAKSGDGYIALTVRDNGIGIREEDRQEIFQMYHRLNADVPGTGVGMTIVSRLVENSGGRIEVESEFGKGSVFKVYLPG